MSRLPRTALAFLIAALVSALVGHAILTHRLRLAGIGSESSFRLGVLCLGAAILLAMFAAARPGVSAAAGASRLRPVRRAISAAGVACGVLAAVLYAVSGESLAVEILWAAGTLLFLFSFSRSRGTIEGSAEGDARWWEVALLFALAALGFALRYVRLTDWPAELDADFGSVGLQVVALINSPHWIGVGDGNHPLVSYNLIRISTSLFGLNLHGLMIQSVLFGTLQIGAVYFLGREVGGRGVGLFAAALLAMSYTAIHFSRVIYTPAAVLAVTLMVALLLRGLRTGGRWWFALAGFTGGAACLLYLSGRVAPVLAAVILIGDLAKRRGDVRRRLMDWTVMAAAALLTIGPMLVFYARTPRAMVARTAETMIFTPPNRIHSMTKYGVHTIPAMLLEQTRRTFLTFHVFGDSNSEFGYPGPLVDGPTAAFLLLGLGLMLRHPTSPGALALLSWLLIVLIVGGVLTLDPPDWVHLVAALPAVAVLSALGMQRLLALFGESFGRPAKLVTAGVLITVLAGTAIENWRGYRRAIEDNAGPYCAVARFIDGLPAGTRILLVRDPLSFLDRTLRFFCRGADGTDVTEEDIRLLTAVEKPTVVILTPNHSQSLLPLLQQRFPSAQALGHVSHGWLHFRSVQIVPAGTPPAPPYNTFGKTSAAGWVTGLLLAAALALLALPPKAPAGRPAEPRSLATQTGS